MPYGFTPPSQKYRRVTFDLSGGGAGGTVDLVIRPEELTRVEPSRLSVQQTLAGAWADAFDRGVATIRLSGHTGWHGGPAGTGGAGLSGEQQFLNFRSTAFQGWHDARSAVVAGGGDPAVVELMFIDELDRFSALVAPKVFTLRRSKTRPLLMMYVIELLVLADGGDPGGGAGGGAGLDGIAAAFGDFLGGAQELAGIAGQIAGLANGDPGAIAGFAGAAGNLLAGPGAGAAIGQVAGIAAGGQAPTPAQVGNLVAAFGGLF